LIAAIETLCEEGDADARLIVAAVNNFEQLRSTLLAAREALFACSDEYGNNDLIIDQIDGMLETTSKV
jgi:hypothetical protein